MPPTHPKRRGIFLAFLLSAVACWGATFGAFRGIGEGGTASPRESWSRGKAPAYPEYARGVAPCSPLERALRPTPRGILQGRRSLRPTICEGAKPPLHSPMRGRSAPPPRVTFSPMRKSPKNLQGLRPLESPEGGTLSPLRQAAPPNGDFSHKNRPICHFELVGKSVFVFSFGFFGETFPAFNPWHGRFLAPRMPRAFFARNQNR